jgi:hypothetical protein
MPQTHEEIMNITLTPEDVELILESLLFACSCDVISSMSDDDSIKILDLAEKIKKQALTEGHKTFSTSLPKVELYDSFEGEPIELEQPELADRIRKILRA